MQSLFWHLTNRTAESLLILNLFHLLLAGLTLLVLLHQLGVNRKHTDRADRLVTFGFFLLVIHFAALTLHFGASFFLHRPVQLVGLERISHGLFVAGVLVIVAAYLDSGNDSRFWWVVAAFPVLAGTVLVDVSSKLPPLGAEGRPHSVAMLAGDLLGFLAVALGAAVVARGKCRWEGGRVRLLALASMALVLLLHGLPSFVPGPVGVVVWNAEEQILSLALFAFTWAAGERSGNLLERVFVRLNLTFIILASLIMLSTAEMAKYQYLRLAEERSMNLAEVLRGHVIYFRDQGESVEQIFAHPEVLRRIVAEFGNLPELREINTYFRGQRVRFRYAPDLEVQETITPQLAPSAENGEANSFTMIRLPIGEGSPPADYVEFIGTMDFVNAYIGKYLIFIYCAFTVIVVLATAIIGIIVRDTDRQLRRQYTELQEAHQQLAQAAKLASIGELAGGMAHEINNPITSILALSSHMAGKPSGEDGLSPRERKNLQLIAQQAERVSALVGGLLSFSRQSQLHLSQLDIGELLKTALDLVQYRLKDGRIQVRLRIPAGLPHVTGDASRLSEVFVNLLKNAIDAMPEGGTLGVEAAFQPEDGAVRVEVRDSGHGIPAEHLPRIFDPFFTTKAPGRGTGLGLSISHGIVKDHGGEIWARSEPGQGTTFAVSLLTEVNCYETTCSRD